ncbi:MAG: hypothetical protein IPM24_06905 [Bryobacterales bacterium]|nr:hypothetical protein [Bryobacterales bacterium]
MWTLLALLLFQAPFQDLTHPSAVVGQQRTYRLFLPAGYHQSGRRYPVIYYFHGHSDRYTLERYDGGKDTVPKILDFVARHDAIVVAVDGHIPEHYTGFYGGTPYDIYADGALDFGLYFRELVAHIDSTLRTVPDRRHRATSGLSMGGFMSLSLSARFPELIGSASSFNPGPEFYLGAPGRRVLWRPKDHVHNHTHTMIRLIRASGDYISQYHEETRLAYARASGVDFEFRQDEYHRHWATSIGETFAFHMRAFANSALNNLPEVFHHDSPFPRFSAWGWEVETSGDAPGHTTLAHVSQQGLRLLTRRWAPDGPPVEGRTVALMTPPLYKANAEYTVLDVPLWGGEAVRRTVEADAAGRIRYTTGGEGRQISFTGPGAGAQAPVLLPVARGEFWRVLPAIAIPVPLRVYNPRPEPLREVRVEVTSAYPTVQLNQQRTVIPEIPPGGVVDLSNTFEALFTAGAGDFAPARIQVRLAAGPAVWAEDVDVMIAPDPMPAPLEYRLLDGRAATFPVFRQKGNQGGGSAIERTVTEGKGNGNGILEPGEEATIWVRLTNGIDPFDKGNWYRAKIYTDSPWVAETARLEEQKQLEWTGAKELTSVIRLSREAPRGETIPLVLSNESWSYHYTPDVRYGVEPLYQAFQLHRRHVHRLVLEAGR